MDDECFTSSKRDLVLNTAPGNAFGSMVALLALYVWRQIHKVATPMPTLGDVEDQRQRKLRCKFQEVKRRKSKVEVWV